MRILPLVWLTVCVTSRAAIVEETFTSGFLNGGNIPDGNATGWSDTRTFTSVVPGSISELSVDLDLVGGFNGDLYAYLSHAGVLVPLLNRVGVTASVPSSDFGYSDAGVKVTFSTLADFDVHYYGRCTPTVTDGQLTGIWQPDGRILDPLSAPIEFDHATSARISLDSLLYLDPTEPWTLFIADLASGGDQPKVSSWGLNFVAVPEPEHFVSFASLGLLTWAYWRHRRPGSGREQKSGAHLNGGSLKSRRAAHGWNPPARAPAGTEKRETSPIEPVQ